MIFHQKFLGFYFGLITHVDFHPPTLLFLLGREKRRAERLSCGEDFVCKAACHCQFPLTQHGMYKMKEARTPRYEKPAGSNNTRGSCRKDGVLVLADADDVAVRTVSSRGGGRDDAAVGALGDGREVLGRDGDGGDEGGEDGEELHFVV